MCSLEHTGNIIQETKSSNVLYIEREAGPHILNFSSN